MQLLQAAPRRGCLGAAWRAATTGPRLGALWQQLQLLGQAACPSEQLLQGQCKAAQLSLGLACSAVAVSPSLCRVRSQRSAFLDGPSISTM